MDVIDLSPLYALQAELDAEIAKIHGITYESTFERRLLSLLVEVGEFANETRCFKYWSYKPSSPLETVLEEYVDGLHFLLSLGIPLGVREYQCEIRAKYGDLTTALLEFYSQAASLRERYELDSYLPLVDEYLAILPLIGADSKSVIESYQRKMEENHRRQANHY